MGFRVSGGGRTARQAASPRVASGFRLRVRAARRAWPGMETWCHVRASSLGRIKDMLMRWDLENDGEGGTMGFQRPAQKGEVGAIVRQVVGRLMEKVPDSSRHYARFFPLS